ncbi:hypothetical protein M3573_19510 [Bacillus safensis]|uniref:hypothetical protein n=1 Tax=Bacillus safensis TaxID=561879 RepID=UPI00203DFF39|nr:hypothetical protein [Bacillus safensis]MCM3140469.1 hypothetical protein [Bacillus safensis]
MKPEITKEQAEAIEFLRKNYDDNRILEIYVHESIGHTDQMHCHSCDSLCDLTLIELADALINGYEIAKSPEQKVREYYGSNHAEHHEVLTGSPRGQYTAGVADGIRKTLDLLGIKIEGVTA